MRYWLNAAVRRDRTFAGLFTGDEYSSVEAYYGAHPELAPAPLRSAAAMAHALRLAAVDIKDESGRFGLTAFKIVGVRYAVHRLGDTVAGRGLVCATAGNHGRAVARVARERALPCTVFVPAPSDIDGADGTYNVARATGDVPRAADVLRATGVLRATAQATRERRIDAMKAEGATVIDVDGSYEEAVRRAAAFGEQTGATILSDVSWPGYDTIPRWIMAGYTHIFEEAVKQWERRPDVVFVQGGVGGLVCAAASWFAWRFGADRPFIIACEPESAACLLESARQGAPVSLSGDMETIMAGLRCAEPSPVAWPAIAAGVDAFVSISDARAIEAMRELERGRPAIAAGPSGACGVAALRAVATEAGFAPVRSAARMDSSTRVLAVVTEAP